MDMKALPRFNILRVTVLSLTVNALYAAANLLIGFCEPSPWFLTLGIYYLLLTLMRLLVLCVKENPVAPKLIGGMLMSTALPLVGTVILCALVDVGTKHHMIVMIAIAAYAFTKITLAIIHRIRSRKRASVAERTLRSISLADAVVSIASLQRSMLVSFEGMTETEIQIFNVATGTVACLFVFAIGWWLCVHSPYNKKHESLS